MKSIGRFSKWLLVVMLACLPARGFALTIDVPPIGTGDIADSAVTTPKLANGAVTNDKIATGTITADKLAFPVTQQSAWQIPDNVRIVQKDNTDGVKVFSSVAAAYASISSPTASTYVIKVMPGVYSENGLTINGNVNIVGSGQGSTVITSAGTTLTINGNSTIENVTITSSRQPNAVVMVTSSAVAAFKGVTLELTPTVTYGIYSEGSVSVSNSKVTNSRTPGDEIFTTSQLTVIANYGTEVLHIEGVTIDLKANALEYIWAIDASKLAVNNSVFNLTNAGGEINAIYAEGKTVISNSRINVNSTSATHDGSVMVLYDGEIINSQLDIIGTTGHKGLVGGSLSIQNSRITSPGVGIDYVSGTIANSIISGATHAITNSSSLKVANTQIIGGIVGGIAKMFNCFDGDYNLLTIQ